MDKTNKAEPTIKELKNLTAEEKQLFELIQEGKFREAKQLVEAGRIRINCLDKNGMNLLDQACFKGDEELVDFLLERGANADNRAHEQGYTALMFAALSGNGRNCQKLLDAGASAHAQNNIGKTAAELAAFVGQHECVSIISSYISFRDVDVILHPKGSESERIYPRELAEFIHRLTRTHAFHPVKLALDIANNDEIWGNVKKTTFTVDRLFEKQLRSKEPNECLSLKLWIILYTLRELTKFVEEQMGKKNNDGDGEDRDGKCFARQFVKIFLQDSPENLVRIGEERFIRQAIASFPYKQAMIWQALSKQICDVPFGNSPPAFVQLCQTLLGARFVQTSRFCRCCWVPSAKKRCKNCRIFYCSVECQQRDWPYHKKCCDSIKGRLEENCEEHERLTRPASACLDCPPTTITTSSNQATVTDEQSASTDAAADDVPEGVKEEKEEVPMAHGQQ